MSNPDGSPFNGTVIITWNGFASTTTGTVTPSSTSARVYNGALSVLLVPSTTAAAGSYYLAVFNSSDGTVTWSETWQVPPSSTALTLNQVRVSISTGTSGGSGNGGSNGGSGNSGGSGTTSGTVTISQVTGLTADLNQINGSLSSLTNTVNSQGSTLNNVSSLANGNATQIATLTGSVASLNSNVTTVSSSLAALTQTVNGLSATTTNAPVFKDAETPTGTINGTNGTFTLANSPTPTTSLALYKNGVLQVSGVDYTLSGASVTFNGASIPATGDALIAYYRMPGTGPATTFADAEVPSGTINGTNLTFTLTASPNPAQSLELFKNGVLLKATADYSLSGNTITFSSVSVTAQNGDTLLASYRH